jgi:hypothetical protein
MSTQKNATISPDRAASDPDPIADTVPSSSRAKRRQEEADTSDGTGPVAAKVARLANANEETKSQAGDETPETSLTTEKMMDLLKGLWSDDKCVIKRTLTEIAHIGITGAWSKENEVKMRELGGHIVVFQLVQKHVGCLEIQEEGICALGNLSRLMPTKKLLGDIGYLEVILARMNKYPDHERVQLLGCAAIGHLVSGMKDNAERVKKSGGIAVVIAAMKAHPNSLRVQSVGCRALLKMSEWEEYRPLIVKAGGPSAIGFVMEKDWDDPEVHESAYKTMEKLFQKPR